MVPFNIFHSQKNINNLPRTAAWVIALTCLLVTRVNAQGPLTLDQALQLSRQNALETQTAQAQGQKALAEARLVDGYYDPVLYGSLQYTYDGSEQLSLFAGNSRQSAQGEIGIRKLFPSATVLDASLRQNYGYTDFPQNQGPFAVEDFQQANPSFTTTLQLTLRQQLWRNWAGRELKLQKQMAENGVATSKYSQAIANQVVQTQTEQLYWALAAVEAQLRYAQQLINLSRQYARLTESRVQIGRADRVDLAAAQTAIVTQEGVLLELELAAKDLRKQLAIRLYPQGTTVSVTIAGDALYNTNSKLPTQTVDAAYQYAMENRQDLKLLAEQQKPLELQKSLIREQNKPDVSLFGSLQTNGLEDNYGSSWVDPFNDGKHLTYVIGLQAHIPLGRTNRRARLDIVAAQNAMLNTERDLIIRDITREIRLAVEAASAAQQKLAQTERQLAAIRAQRDLEAQRVAQARSEQIAVVRYDLDLTYREIERIIALQEAKQASARLRLAMHAYPVE